MSHNNPDWLIKPRDRTQASKPKTGIRPPKASETDREKTRLWLQHIKSDDWWQSQMPIPESRFADVIGIGRMSIWRGLRNTGTYRHTPALNHISRLVADIERRKLVFPQSACCLGLKERRKKENHPPRFLWLEPPENPPQICKISNESSWSLWACCLSCGNNKFLPIMLGEKPQVACYHCIKPDQYRSFGAVPVKKSLIHAFLKTLY